MVDGCLLARCQLLCPVRVNYLGRIDNAVFWFIFPLSVVVVMRASFGKENGKEPVGRLDILFPKGGARRLKLRGVIVANRYTISLATITL